jgi:hypothetical protein
MRASDDRSIDRRVTVPEAAAILKITPDAVRSRLRRGTLRKDQAPGGTVLVVLDGDGLSDQSTDRPTDQTTVAYINALKSQIETLTSELGAWKKEVEEWKEESRRKNTIIISLTQRIPELPPPDVREKPESADERIERLNPPPPEEPREEITQRPWYRRWFGG